jgi:hypothetical protein
MGIQILVRPLAVLAQLLSLHCDNLRRNFVRDVSSVVSDILIDVHFTSALVTDDDRPERAASALVCHILNLSTHS